MIRCLSLLTLLTLALLFTGCVGELAVDEPNSSPTPSDLPEEKWESADSNCETWVNFHEDQGVTPWMIDEEDYVSVGTWDTETTCKQPTQISLERLSFVGYVEVNGEGFRPVENVGFHIDDVVDSCYITNGGQPVSGVMIPEGGVVTFRESRSLATILDQRSEEIPFVLSCSMLAGGLSVGEEVNIGFKLATNSNLRLSSRENNHVVSRVVINLESENEVPEEPSQLQSYLALTSID